MLFPVLLSTFSFALHGIETENQLHEPKIQDSTCPPNTTGIFPNCEHLPSNEQCDEGFTGTFPDCVKVKKPKCRRPNIGTYPNCFLPPCPPSYFGSYPKCQRQPNGIQCPVGSVGVFPMCEINLSNHTVAGTYENVDSSSNTELPVASQEKIQHPIGNVSTISYAASTEVSFPTNASLHLTTTEATPDSVQVLPTMSNTSTSFEMGSTAEFPAQKCREGCEGILSSSVQSTSQSSVILHSLTVSNEMEWENFKLTFNKTYADPKDERKHQKIFLQNQKIIAAHNRLFDLGLETYSLAINENSDRSIDERLGATDNSKPATIKEDRALYLVYAETVNDSKTVYGSLTKT